VWAKPEETEGFAVVLRAIEVFGNLNAPLPAGPPFFRFSDPVETENTLEKNGFVDTAIVKIPLVWRMHSADDVFNAFCEGTVRTGGLLARAVLRGDLCHQRCPPEKLRSVSSGRQAKHSHAGSPYNRP
jgi:hypothetical protein